MDLTPPPSKEKEFFDIWNNSPILREMRRREDLEEYCGECEHKSACGGTRARVYAYFGDYKAPDPGCINNEEVFFELRASAGEFKNEVLY